MRSWPAARGHPIGRLIIKKIRYPSKGGYQSFAQKLIKGAKIHLNTAVTSIDLEQQLVTTATGKTYEYKRLINTMPLPFFIECCCSVPQNIKDAAAELLCSSIQLVNVTAPHETLRRENWMYVYDEDKYSVRINCTEKLSPANAPAGHTGVQVEVYHSRINPLRASKEKVEAAVIDELIEMGLVCPEKAGGRSEIKVFSRMVPWANVVFHHETKPALDCILAWLETQGLHREIDDLDPLTDWGSAAPLERGNLVLAGRFGQWKYFWSDDCVMRGKLIGTSSKSS
jgi:protoporphyrinogen oxidase